MKSLLTHSEPPTTQEEYPVLKIQVATNRIVLFTSHDKGVVVHSPKHDEELGHSSEHFVESAFETFHGEVILSNN